MMLLCGGSLAVSPGLIIGVCLCGSSFECTRAIKVEKGEELGVLNSAHLNLYMSWRSQIKNTKDRK